jgi:hypothetical protein
MAEFIFPVRLIGMSQNFVITLFFLDSEEQNVGIEIPAHLRNSQMKSNDQKDLFPPNYHFKSS